jgi:hypothetical protein
LPSRQHRHETATRALLWEHYRTLDREQQQHLGEGMWLLSQVRVCPLQKLVDNRHESTDTHSTTTTAAPTHLPTPPPPLCQRRHCNHVLAHNHDHNHNHLTTTTPARPHTPHITRLLGAKLHCTWASRGALLRRPCGCTRRRLVNDGGNGR